MCRSKFSEVVQIKSIRKGSPTGVRQQAFHTLSPVGKCQELIRCNDAQKNLDDHLCFRRVSSVRVPVNDVRKERVYDEDEALLDGDRKYALR